MKEAQKPDTASYRTFNEFFVRPLRDEVRPIDTDPNVLVYACRWRYQPVG
ncbi:phosphatidylserine decarboxylase proenzyme [Escherichia coli]|uniref:Phosphatidylserine decarboxylase proenzyme n=1 Tax=Escherichia coli TaxID=562 RepID=A0A377KEP1_ECOLX|nr:phosphatidylserine decarboxylase proenzyme [Escherichia coli]